MDNFTQVPFGPIKNNYTLLSKIIGLFRNCRKLMCIKWLT